MAVSLTHAFQSLKGDGPDTTLVQPSNWNAEHELRMASGRVLGRKSVGEGPVEELLPDIPPGTIMLFVQSAAPVGWTKLTAHNNKALRVVSGVASSGGTVPFSTVFGRVATDGHALTGAQVGPHTHDAGSLAGGAHTHSFSGTTSNNGNHFHPGSVTNTAGSHQHAITNPGTPVGVTSGAGSAAGTGVSGLTDAAGSHSHGVSVSEDGQHSHSFSGTTGGASFSISGSTASAGDGAAHSHNIDLRVQYVDVIYASKD